MNAMTTTLERASALRAFVAICFASACSSSGGSPATVDSGSPTGAQDSGGRTCPGSVAQTASYTVQGTCGDEGTISVSVGAAGSCTLEVTETASVGLPTVGTFNDLASQTGYDLTKGNWSLNSASTGSTEVGVFLDCTSSIAIADGSITLTCEENTCSVGDTDDVQCESGGTCTAHLAPASSPVATPDAG